MASKPQEVSVEEKLRALYDLQLIDSHIDEIKLFMGNLPLEVQELDNEVNDIQNKSQQLQQEIDASQSGMQEKKNLIKDAEVLIKKYRDQQDKVRNNREFESLDKEIEYQELEIELANKRAKEFELIIAQKKDLYEEFNVLCSEKKEYLYQKRKEFDQMLQKHEEERIDLMEKATVFSKNVESRLLQLYKRIRSKAKNGLAIVPVERGASGGSFFTIPPQKCIDIAQRKKVVIDEHSGRILIDAALAEEERQKILPKIRKILIES
ncbi:zinc ribbon domain-containing protein [Bacteroidetes bacterium endosymbiont of Geopemphigus sp.]|uniref:zinc ribbon domain-containing protein n=1 Tax=Bacteroidetes bacterium endosymbiont of Geopemphigus sp. TaxID=2047937 RepID=UPI000CD14D51|nr:hypothetical protein [Bacteroidetes bacterium endosymbiont of Geopemphigus sp.]